MDEVFQTAIAWGLPGGLFLLVLFFVLFYLEKVERIVGWLLSLIAWSSKGVRHRSIKLRLQGQISNFARFTDRECKGSIPYGMKLKFVREINRAELDPNKQTVIVCIRDRGSDERNLVHTMMNFCPVGVVPQARPYLSPEVNEGINITITRKLLNYLRHRGALQYLYNEVLPACISDTPSLDEYCRMFDTLDENGLFTRVFLEEIRIFGTRIETRYPQESHTKEASEFLKYVYNVATRPKGEELAEIGHSGRYISTAFVFVGIGRTMLQEGAATYLRHLQRLRNEGYERAYLAARGNLKEETKEASLSIQIAERASYLAEYKNLVKRSRSMRYYATTQGGSTREHALIELLIIPQSEN